MPDFTPGPWVFEKDKLHPFFYVSKEKSKTFLATVNNEANARLIVAAPEMENLIRELAALPDEQCMISNLILTARKIIARIDSTEDKS